MVFLMFLSFILIIQPLFSKKSNKEFLTDNKKNKKILHL